MRGTNNALARLTVLLLAMPVIVRAQTVAPRPFVVGERAEYEVKYGIIRAGSASLSVVGIDTVRGRDAYRFRLTFAASVNVLVYRYSTRDTMQSWVDTSKFQSLRFHQDQVQRGKARTKRYEIFPDRRTFTDGNDPEQPSVTDPLDDVAFLYFVRTQNLDVGYGRQWSRYFKATNNPVMLKALRKETIEVAGRKWNTVVVQPIIKTSTLFSDGAEAQVWISDDSVRAIVQIKTKLSVGSITMRLTSYVPSSTVEQPKPERPPD
jgi:hypothetical protein